MSLVDPLPTIDIPSRERQINNAVIEAAASVGLAMIIECGSVGAFEIAIEEQEGTVRANFRDATKRALRRAGVLDEDFNIIPGQEEHAQRHGFGKER